MSTDVPQQPPAPSPRDVARLRHRRGPAATDAAQVRRLECLVCERATDHVPGPATYAKDGTLLVQWWRCLVCQDGVTVP